jgi:type I restriction enzyme S subunit
MVADLKPYPTMKDSGVPWLAEVPEHWDVRRLKRVVALNPSKSEAAPVLAEDAPVTFLPMERVSADGRFDSRESRAATAVWNGFTYFRRSDVLVAKITPCFENGKGACLDALPTEVGFGSTEFIVLRATAAISPQYLYRTTTLAAFRRLGADSMTGSAGQQRVSPQFVSNFPTVLPPLPEQSAIVRFLDHACRRIGRYIHAKQKLIKLLEEQRQAVIHHAITCGLDPNARLKPSGVEWLGDVPEHWEVVQLRRRWELVDCKHLTVPFVDEGIPLASVREVRGFDLDLSKSMKTMAEWYGHLIGGRRAPKRGDLIYCRNVNVGECAYVNTDQQFAMGQDVCLIRSRAENGRFLNYIMRSTAMQKQLSLLLIGSTFNRINVSEIKSLVIAVPSRDEQDAIVSYLDSRLVGLDKSIGVAQREIALLCEYRTRLVADVVTGKLDVRGAAASLPEEPETEEQEPLEEDAAAEAEAEEDAGEDDPEGVEEAAS